MEIKAFQVCIWTGSILIRLDIHQIGDYGHLDRVQQSRDIHQMNDADGENIEDMKSRAPAFGPQLLAGGPLGLFTLSLTFGRSSRVTHTHNGDWIVCYTVNSDLTKHQIVEMCLPLNGVLFSV